MKQKIARFEISDIKFIWNNFNNARKENKQLLF